MSTWQHWWVFCKGRKGGKNGPAIHQELLSQPQRRTMKRCPCKGPEQIFTYKILNQCKGQSTPFFQITAKFHLLLIGRCLMLFPAAWESFTDFSHWGNKDAIASCYMWGCRHWEWKDWVHLLQFKDPKVFHPHLNQWPQALCISSDGKLHLVLKISLFLYLWIKGIRGNSLACQQLNVGRRSLPMCSPTALGQQQDKNLICHGL